MVGLSTQHPGLSTVLRRITNLKDVVDWGLCLGCGVCKYALTAGTVELIDVESAGLRPVFDAEAADASAQMLHLCPGYSVDAALATGPVRNPTAAEREFGPTFEIWEGYAADPEVRHRGSSGGMLSALALWCLEQENMAFVLHAGMDLDKPWLNRTVTSRTRAEILARAGSRYAPASPCEGLDKIETSDRPCVFIGKPCDTAAVMAVRRHHPALHQRLGAVLTFFCAGTPSTRGTLDLLNLMQIQREAVQQLRYRGEGWPGGFTVTSGERARRDFMHYQQAWPALTPYVPLRCRLCPDGLGRLADISCGDAWEQYDEAGSNPGMSIVLVRTQRGREILQGAAEAGYVKLVRVGPEAVLAAQPHLLSKRQELFGRLLALRLLLIPIPRFWGFSEFYTWIRLPRSLQFRTLVGTLKRALMRGWWKRRHIQDYRSKAHSPGQAHPNRV